MSEQAAFSLKRIIISTITLLAAFILTKLFLEGMVYLISNQMGYQPSFSFNNIHHGIDDFRKWTRLRVLGVDLFPPVFSLLLGVGLYYLMRRQTRSWGYLQFFCYWLMVCLINSCFAQFIFAPLGVDDTTSPFYQTIAIAEVWCYLPVALTAAFAILTILAAAASGYLLSVETVKLTHSQRLVSDNAGKTIVILQLYLLPLLLAALPILLLGRGLYTLPLVVTVITLVLFPTGMFLRNWRGPYRVRFQKTEVRPAFILVALGLTAMLWLGVYVYLK